MVFSLEGEFGVELQDLLIWKAGVDRVVDVVVVEEGGPAGVHVVRLLLVMVESSCGWGGRGEGGEGGRRAGE